MTATDQLSRFCGDNCRYDLGEPFVIDGWAYATDGAIMARQSTAQFNSTDRKLPEGAPDFPWPSEKAYEGWQPLPELPKLRFEDCPACGKPDAVETRVNIGGQEFDVHRLAELRDLPELLVCTHDKYLLFTWDAGEGILCRLYDEGDLQDE